MQPSQNASKQVSMYDARVWFVQICMYALFFKFLFIILNFSPINGFCKQTNKKKINFINTGDPYNSVGACMFACFYFYFLFNM